MVGAEATAKAFACTSGVREDEEEALRLLFRAFVTANTDVVTAQVRPTKHETVVAAAATATVSDAAATAVKYSFSFT